MDAFEQGSRESADFMIWKRAIRWNLIDVTPFAVWREECGEALQISAVMSEPDRVRVGKRLGDIEADMAGAPTIVEADIKQVRAERQLEHDADVVEQSVIAVPVPFLKVREEAFGIVVAELAIAAALLAAPK